MEKSTFFLKALKFLPKKSRISDVKWRNKSIIYILLSKKIFVGLKWQILFLKRTKILPCKIEQRLLPDKITYILQDRAKTLQDR